MIVYLLWSIVPTRELMGIFATRDLAQKWLDAQLENGAWTKGEHDWSLIEPCQVYDQYEIQM